jgi:phosphosulfolactate synthase
VTGPGAGFLDLPPRHAKPRSLGLTHVIDKGTPVAAFDGLVASIAHFTDMWKFGWGTAYIDPSLRAKVELLRRHEVLACPGGTLLEIASLRGRTDRLLAWAEDVGFTALEVSNGATEMAAAEKHGLIAKASRRFVVVSEVGTKDPQAVPSLAAYEQEVVADLEAGARWVVVEGRESGTVGLYHQDGRVREELADRLTAAVGPERLVLEAPRRDQQAWFIRRFGPTVNLGNIAPDDVFGLETLRWGLRADTIGLLDEA